MSQEIADLQKAVADQAEVIAAEHAQINAELAAQAERIDELEEQLAAENPDLEAIAAATADIKKHNEAIADMVEPTEPAPVVDNTLPGAPRPEQLPAKG